MGFARLRRAPPEWTQCLRLEACLLHRFQACCAGSNIPKSQLTVVLVRSAFRDTPPALMLVVEQNEGVR